MKFLVDESSGKSVAKSLKSLGHDVIYVHDWEVGAADPDILQKAVQQKRIVVTNDKDFGELVHRSGLEHAGVLLFRLQDEQIANRKRMILKVLEKCGDKLQGNFVVATEQKIRIRTKF